MIGSDGVEAVVVEYGFTLATVLQKKYETVMVYGTNSATFWGHYA